VKISRLIKELQKQLDLHGDIQVIQEATLGGENDTFLSTIERMRKIDRWLDDESVKFLNVDREESALMLTWKMG
jgi:hypothetical protein